ncbi:MAG: ABC transporter ATP-binding protein [Lachnoclostridium edouardi]|uniref:ABC transporter ATP-binding protein n=1 Tax=Lachnoclostridium edouardi TaxID=1926283 RepID=UPI0026DACEB7|nr:ABC transporter ATP-binding protein [Lachnoclostridium edouardi]MDO4279785.1 ABC transporter ATP-binding protein [Lachnoclostridium edouardi]
MKDTILEVKNFSVSFTQYEKWFHKIQLPVIRDLDVTVKQGEITAVVGSSGSGKSLLAHGILGLLPYNAALEGEIYLEGELLSQKRKEELRGSKMVLVPQSVSFLDPLMKVGKQVRNGKKDRLSVNKSRQLLNRYGLPENTENLYPFQLSGGMTRRIMISTALMGNPKLVIADEPTPGLHLSAAKRVLSHFREIANQGAGVLLITHDLELALNVADRVTVLYAGTAVEEADVKDFDSLETLRHPYTKALYKAMPEHGFFSEPGNQPYVRNLPAGCPYQARCSRAEEKCKGEIPALWYNGGRVRCVLYGKEENL